MSGKYTQKLQITRPYSSADPGFVVQCEEEALFVSLTTKSATVQSITVPQLLLSHILSVVSQEGRQSGSKE